MTESSDLWHQTSDFGKNKQLAVGEPIRKHHQGREEQNYNNGNSGVFPWPVQVKFLHSQRIFNGLRMGG